MIVEIYTMANDSLRIRNVLKIPLLVVLRAHAGLPLGKTSPRVAYII